MKYLKYRCFLIVGILMCSALLADFFGGEITLDNLVTTQGTAELCGRITPSNPNSIYAVTLSRKCSFDLTQKQYTTMTNSHGFFCLMMSWEAGNQLSQCFPSFDLQLLRK